MDDRLFDADRYLAEAERKPRKPNADKHEETRTATPDGPWKLISSKKKGPVAHYTYAGTVSDVAPRGASDKQKAEIKVALNAGSQPLLCGKLGAALMISEATEAPACPECLTAIQQGKHFNWEGRS